MFYFTTLPTKYFMWHILCLSTSFLYHLGPVRVTVFLYISWNYLLSYQQILSTVWLPYTSDQSTFVKPNVNVLKDIQILTKTTYVQQEADNMLIPVSSSWVILSGYCLENITTSRCDCCPQLIHLVTSGEIVISLSKI